MRHDVPYPGIMINCARIERGPKKKEKNRWVREWWCYRFATMLTRRRAIKQTSRTSARDRSAARRAFSTSGKVPYSFRSAETRSGRCIRSPARARETNFRQTSLIEFPCSRERKKLPRGIGSLWAIREDPTLELCEKTFTPESSKSSGSY